MGLPVTTLNGIMDNMDPVSVRAAFRHGLNESSSASQVTNNNKIIIINLYHSIIIVFYELMVLIILYYTFDDIHFHIIIIKFILLVELLFELYSAVYFMDSNYGIKY